MGSSSCLALCSLRVVCPSQSEYQLQSQTGSLSRSSGAMHEMLFVPLSSVRIARANFFRDRLNRAFPTSDSRPFSRNVVSPRHVFLSSLASTSPMSESKSKSESLERRVVIPKLRLRQHVNPLASRFREPIHLPSDWYSSIFADTSLPLTVDIGVARGQFLHRLAKRDPTRNYLGLEIRSVLVEAANALARAEALDENLHYLTCNANVSLRQVLAAVKPGVLEDVLVQFCDPWFKKRHAKRRMVTPPFANDIADALARANEVDAYKSRRVFVQTDVLEVAKEIRHIFDQQEGLQRAPNGNGLEWNEHGWLTENPLPERTEREIAVMERHGHVYRAMFVTAQSTT